jgi:hypothetical protein
MKSFSPPDEIAFGLKETGARQDQEDQPGEEPREEEVSSDEGAEEQEKAEPEAEGSEEEGEGEESPMSGRVAWFLFPIIHEDKSRPGNAVAVEAATRSGMSGSPYAVSSSRVATGSSHVSSDDPSACSTTASARARSTPSSVGTAPWGRRSQAARLAARRHFARRAPSGLGPAVATTYTRRNAAAHLNR